MKRLVEDLRGRRNIEAYAAMAVASTFALLGIIGDVVPESLKWSAIFAGFAVLLYRIVLPARPDRSIDAVIGNRESLPAGQFCKWLESAEQFWVFAPSAVNLLSADNCDLIRRTVMSRADGAVRIAVIDPAEQATVLLAKKQLDDSLSFPVQEFISSLNSVINKLEAIGRWKAPGSFEYRLLGVNPGFSIIAVNPHRSDGEILVEFHGFKNEAIGSRMHFLISRKESVRWFDYWVAQFEHIWHSAKPSPVMDSLHSNEANSDHPI